MTRPLWSLRLAFGGLGITASAFPAAIPSLAAQWDVQPARLLPAVPLLFGGLLAGVLATSLVPPRFLQRCLALGGLLQAAALLGFLVVAGPPVFWALAAVAGIGFGLVEASATVLARRLTTEVTSLLSQLTALVAVAAALTPLPLAVLGATPRLVGCLAVVPLAASIAVAGRWPPAAVHPVGRRRDGLPLVLVPAAVSLFAYVGAESVLSGWSSVLPQVLLGLSGASAAIGTSAFWCLLGAGRALAWLPLRRGRQPRALLRGFLGVAMVASVGAAVVPSEPAAVALVAVACLGIAPSYAFLLGYALEGVSTARAARATGPLVAVGSLGGTVVPALLVAHTGRTVLIWVAVMLVVVVAAAGGRRRLPEHGTSNDESAESPVG